MSVFARYAESKKHDTTAQRRHMVQRYKEGTRANAQVKDIVKTGHKFLQHAETPEDFKHLEAWVDYCYKLIPDKYSVNNLYANVLYRQGKNKEAIALKQKALNGTPDSEKKKVNVAYELEMMEQGKELMLVSIDGK